MGAAASRSGSKCPLPGLFDTAEDAAVLLALVKKGMKERNDGKVFVPPKQNKPHKPRSKPAVPNEASPPASEADGGASRGEPRLGGKEAKVAGAAGGEGAGAGSRGTARGQEA